MSGEKTIETRTYPLPDRLKGVPLALVETPGQSGGFKSRVVATITFSMSFAYDSETQFYNDIDKHCVAKGSKWKWSGNKPKFGWVIESVTILNEEISLKKRPGIIYTKQIEVPNDL